MNNDFKNEEGIFPLFSGLEVPTTYDVNSTVMNGVMANGVATNGH